ncbi:hypothetical protein Bhyg_14056 [Pseudolycoriella hygida]|uniref:Reverse transcriptase domain-containing protein n=1 Tax=Pseudolycoriella hygida TaxID=35572 RepID=A0A9Q0RVA2_9DIPT|nr:hypothetical protein Bhyg_14056 [Pseudolycoriella hygida]
MKVVKFATYLMSSSVPVAWIKSDGQFAFKNVTSAEVVRAIHTIKSKTIGLDGVRIVFVKMILPFILPVLTHIINHCFTSSTIPKCWKLAKVIPNHKKTRLRGLDDFRPLSILPCLSKVLEVIAKEQPVEYIYAMAEEYLEEAERYINENISSICAWARNNGLVLNASKTQAIVFSNTAIRSALPNVVIDGTTVTFTEAVKNPGVTMDVNMSFNAHVRDLSLKVFAILVYITNGARRTKGHRILLAQDLLTMTKQIQSPHATNHSTLASKYQFRHLMRGSDSTASANQRWTRWEPVTSKEMDFEYENTDRRGAVAISATTEPGSNL